MNKPLRPPSMLTRHPENPIIAPAQFPHFEADAVYNCGHAMYKGKTVLLVSVVPRHGRIPGLYVAESTDGLHFEFHSKPLITQLQDDRWKRLDIWPIDPRLTQIGDEYYIIRPGNSESGECISYLYRTRDFESAEFLDCVALPNNRVPSLFPEKINGYYARLDRPFSLGAANERGTIWVSYSPDLIHWGQHRFLMTGSEYWNFSKVGPTPPIKTEQGWLEIFHGAGSTSAGMRYSLGAMLLDLNDPSRILGRMTGYILTPEMDYEFQGWVPNVVFSCGALADLQTRSLRIYYGAADTCIGLAQGNLDEIIAACLQGK